MNDTLDKMFNIWTNKIKNSECRFEHGMQNDKIIAESVLIAMTIIIHDNNGCDFKLSEECPCTFTIDGWKTQTIMIGSNISKPIH